MLVAGNEGSADATEVKRMAKRIEGIKTKIGRGVPSGFAFQTPDTKLSGPRLLNDIPDVIPAIVDFIMAEVQIDEVENPWVDRL